MSQDYQCRKCMESVQMGAQACPHCGYQATGARAKFGIAERWNRLLKWGFYFSIVGLPIGLWFRRKQKKIKRRQKLGVAEPAE